MEYNIEKELKNIKFNFHKNYNGIYLTDEQASILRQYGFDTNNYRDTKDLIVALDTYLNEENIPELESVLYELSEFDYYHNTNK